MKPTFQCAITTSAHSVDTYNPISLKSKEGFKPKSQPVKAISIFASGGWTSMKNWLLIYLDANPPKWTSSKLFIHAYK